MNEYAVMAQKHWREFRPAAYRAIPEPARSSFFSRLGEDAATQITALTAALAGPDQPGEDYLEKVGRLNMAKLQAEEQILAELVLTPGEEEDTDGGEMDLVTDVQAAIDRARAEAELEA